MNKVITYVYLSGRKERLKQDFKDAEEFFYSYLYFKRQGFNTEVIEFSHSDNYINSLLKFSNHNKMLDTNYGTLVHRYSCNS